MVKMERGKRDAKLEEIEGRRIWNRREIETEIKKREAEKERGVKMTRGRGLVMRIKKREKKDFKYR